MVITTQRGTIPITQGTAINAAYFATYLPIQNFTGLQVQPSIGIAQSSTFAFGAGFKVSDFVLRKTWPLVNITGSGDTEYEWKWAMPIITGNVRGWATGATDHLQVGGTATVVWDQIGTVTLTSSGDSKANITAFRMEIPKRRGGPVPVSVGFQFSGPTDTAGTASEWHPSASLVTDDAPPAGTFSITNTGGPAPSQNVLNHMIEVRADLSRGGPLIVRRAFRGSKS